MNIFYSCKNQGFLIAFYKCHSSTQASDHDFFQYVCTRGKLEVSSWGLKRLDSYLIMSFTRNLQLQGEEHHQ
jgi:hypothetical protein